MVITSIGNSKVKYYTKLMSSKKFRDKEKLYVVEGDHLVEEAINTNIVQELIISDEKYDHYTFSNKVFVTNEIMNKICDTVTPQGIIALCKQSDKSELSAFERLLLIDNVQDPGNLGTMIRSADAFNFDGVVLNLQTVDIYNPKVVRATQGAIFRVPIIRKDLSRYIPILNEKGVRVYGTSFNGYNMSEEPSTSNMAFILGNEGNGVSENLLNMTDKNLFIEMNGESESLNVGVAASIIMYYFRK